MPHVGNEVRQDCHSQDRSSLAGQTVGVTMSIPDLEENRMNVRCNFCGHSFSLSREFLATAVPQAQEQKQKSVVVACANCRKQVKVPVRQMQRFVPRPAPDAPTTDEE